MGITTFTDLVGNDYADAAADEATALYGTDLLNVAGWFHDRAEAYLAFMKKSVTISSRATSFTDS